MMHGTTFIESGIVPTICRQCGLHCGINAYIEEGRIQKISGLRTHPQNEGRLCPKGPAAVDMIYHPDRLRKPLKKNPDGSFSEIPLEQAMDEIASKLTDIRENYGARAVACWQGEALGVGPKDVTVVQVGTQRGAQPDHRITPGCRDRHGDGEIAALGCGRVAAGGQHRQESQDQEPYDPGGSGICIVQSGHGSITASRLSSTGRPRAFVVANEQSAFSTLNSP